jgi:predicted acetyltransferase
MQTDLTLRLPRQDEEEFLRAHRATSPEVPFFLHYYEEGIPFSRYLEVLAEQERGSNLPPSHVPSTFLFAFAATRIVGRVSIRHLIPPTTFVINGFNLRRKSFQPFACCFSAAYQLRCA